jgi:hypothetical protein
LKHTWEPGDKIREERKSGIEAASVGSSGVKMLSDEGHEAHVDIAIIIKKEMNVPGISSPSSIALTGPGFASFALVPRKLECPCAVEGIINAIAS